MSWKSAQWRASCRVLPDGQTDGRTYRQTDRQRDRKMVKVPIRNFTKALKILLQYRLNNLGLNRIFYNSFL